MNLINKINRLNKIPQPLNKKRESEKVSEKKNENQKKESGFTFEHDDAFIKNRTEETNPKPASTEKRKTTNEGVGNHIDVTI